MPLLGTLVGVKDAVFKWNGNEVGCDNVEMNSNRELVDVSTNASAGCVERFGCFRDCSIEFDCPWRVKGVAMTPGDLGIFQATVTLNDVIISLSTAIESIRVIGKAKDVWRLHVSLKTVTVFTFTLPGT